MTHLYVGDGKGKTSAAVGLAVRMLGYGRRVLFCRFLKGKSGEVDSLRSLGAQVMSAPNSGKFTFQMSHEELLQARVANTNFFGELRDAARGGGFAMIVLDEIIDAANANLIETNELVSFIEELATESELVLTGRDPGEKIESIADYYTEFRCRAHPYEKGISARRGVEF